jgi:hypothetical protein
MRNLSKFLSDPKNILLTIAMPTFLLGVGDAIILSYVFNQNGANIPNWLPIIELILIMWILLVVSSIKLNQTEN